MNNIRIAAIALALSFSPPAFSQSQNDSGFYIGASIGQVSAKDACAGVSGSGVTCEDTDTGLKLFGGYQVNRNFAVEIGFADLGEAKASGPGGTESIESRAFEVVAVGILPLADRFSLYGKLGMFSSQSDDRVNTTFGSASASDSTTGVTVGVGVKFDLTKNFAIRGEWQRYADVGGDDIGKSDMDLLSAGALFRF